MSKINDLIEQYARNGVKRMALGDIAVLQRGASITKKDVRDGNVPVVAGGRTAAYYHAESNRDGETVVVAGSGAYAGFVSWWEGPIFVSDAFSVKVNNDLLLPKFTYYWLTSQQARLHSEKKGGGVPHVYAKDVARYEMPVPPLEIQREIVRILDSFTALEAELEAELEARRLQYAHYRSDLLDGASYSNATELRVDDICSINRGIVISKDYLRDNPGNFPVYSSQTTNGGVFGLIDTFSYDDSESITWTTDGANAGSVFYHQNEKFTITNVCGRLIVKSPDVLSRFLFYQLEYRAKSYVNEGMGNPKLMANHMAAVRLPVPSLDEQRRIVGILDKFDALVNDLTSGLPAEIEARRQQYAYYRDRLLTFKEAS